MISFKQIQQIIKEARIEKGPAPDNNLDRTSPAPNFRKRMRQRKSLDTRTPEQRKKDAERENKKANKLDPSGKTTKVYYSKFRKLDK